MKAVAKMKSPDVSISKQFSDEEISSCQSISEQSSKRGMKSALNRGKQSSVIRLDTIYIDKKLLVKLALKVQFVAKVV